MRIENEVFHKLHNFFKIKKPINSRIYALVVISSLLFFVSCYCFLSYRQHQINPQDTTIPNFSQFVNGFHKIITPQTRRQDLDWQEALNNIWLYQDLKATVTRHLSGLLLGTIISLIIGLAMGCFPLVEAFFIYPVSFFTKIPPTAMMAVYFVLFGTENKMFIAMIALGIAPILIQTIFLSVQKDVDSYMLDKAYTLGASNFEIIYNVIYKQILPRIIDSVRLQIGPAMIVLIAAEMLVADVGFGYRIRLQSRLQNMNIVYIYLCLLGIMGYLLDWLFIFSRKYFSRWFEGDRV